MRRENSDWKGEEEESMEVEIKEEVDDVDEMGRN